MVENIAWYIGGVRFNIPDELSLSTPRSFDESYQLALKDEEKIKRRQKKQSNSRGGSSIRGRGGRKNLDFQSSNDKDKEKTFS